MKKILLIAHEVSRTGSPMVALLFLKWMQTHNPQVVVDVLALNGGVLKTDFQSACQNYYDYTELTKSPRLTLLKRVFLKLKLYKKPDLKQLLAKAIAENDYNVIYANSIPTLSVAVTLKNYIKGTKLILHVHELNTVMKMYLNNDNNDLHHVDKFIAVSYLVKNNLINNWQVATEKVGVVYEFSQINKQHYKKESKKFIIGASGTVEWRKGDDVFIQIARYVTKKITDTAIEFVWVGKNNKQAIVEADLEKLNLQGKVKFIGEKENPSEYFKEFDVFLMTSREDPFPLVCIEVANIKKPIICFKEATGIQEVLEQGGGYVVPYLDIEQMAEKVIFYYNNPSVLEQDGLIASRLFSKFTPEYSCPLIYNSINELMPKN